MRKVRIILGAAKKTAKKASKGDFTYKGQGVHKVVYKAARYGVTNGPQAFVRKAKQEVVSINNRNGSNLAFPNGLVTGIEPGIITDWYTKHHKQVTIVIPSYNDMNVLVPCIESIKKTTNPKYVKVIIVDDYCQESSRKALKTLEDEQVSVIYRKENGGFAKAVNTGLDAANQKHDVVLLNSDIVAHPDWLEALQYGAYEFGTDTGIVGPKLLYPDGRIQSAGSHRNTDAPQWFDHYYRFQDANYGPANIPQYCLAITGACLYIKREFMDYVGTLDDKFQFAYEDVDWCLRGWESGYRTLYFPAATLTHVESATRPKNKTIGEKEKQSIKYFWEKWGDWFDKRNVRNAQGQIRIIFVLQSLGMSGGIKIVFEHANRLAKKKGYAVEIWSLDSHDCPWEADPNVKLRSFKNYDRLTTALSQEEAIKVATWWETAFPVWLASVKKGIPVYFIQEIESWFYPNDVVAQSSVIACYRKEFINMTTSQYNLDEIKALGLTATAIPCGYDNTTFKKLPKVTRRKDVLLAVGRSFFQKNFPMTLAGWKGMGENRPKMWLFGVEPDMQRLDSKIKYYKKPSNEEVNKLYNEATVFVQTSRHEGFSLPPLEAMASGTPVICTDSHGNRDFCHNGKNCIIVEHDDTAALTKALEKLFKSPALQKKMSAEALKTAKQYQWNVVIKKVEKFYDKVAKQ